jgi:hypothetical protein
MTHADLQRRDATDRYLPRRYNALTQGRFLRARRKGYLARVSGPPTVNQIEMARSMAVLEWGSLVAENEGSLQSLREAREHRRLLLRVLADFERSATAAQAPPPVDPVRAVRERLATIATEREGAA